jgi:hypothetical protein
MTNLMKTKIHIIRFSRLLSSAAKTVRSAPSISSAFRTLTVLTVGILSVAFFFRYQIANGFTRLAGDRYDDFIELSILEHWYNVAQGFSHWSQMNYFYPVAGSLGYNDGYFFYGLIYAVFRWSGADQFLSGELVNVIVRSIGFFAFYFASRRIFHISLPWALLGAVVFTISNNIFMHILHGQLLSVSFAPLLALLVHNTLQALIARQRGALILWGSAFNVLFAASLFTGFYMAWYFAFLGCATLLTWIVIAGSERRRDLLTILRDEALPLTILLCTAVAVNAPFLSVYLPKAMETGMHPYNEVFQYSPSLLDVVHVGDNNLLFGRLQVIMNQYFRPGFPSFSERTTGFPPAVLFLYVCATVSLCWRFCLRVCDKILPMQAMALSTLLTWALTLHIGQFSPYYLVYLLIPGAKAVRVIARYQIFLAAPVIVLAVLYLSQNSLRIAKPLLAIIVALLVVEEINIAPPLSLDRFHEIAWLAAIPSPPSNCQAFFVSAARPEALFGPATDKLVSHNIDAMLIAETKRLPTVNGSSTFLPSGWHLESPDSPSYLAMVKAFASQNGVRGLCALDLQAVNWNTRPFAEQPAAATQRYEK